MELTLAQKAMLSGSICPYCGGQASDQRHDNLWGCRACGAYVPLDTAGKPMGRLAKPKHLEAMRMVETEIKAFLSDTGQREDDFKKELSSEIGIPVEHLSPYKMSMDSLLNVMRHVKTYGGGKVSIYGDDKMGSPCPLHGGIAIGSSACRGCPSHLFVVEGKVRFVVCDSHMCYGRYVGKQVVK